ncbi:hypothetical protein N234_07695 [Ralstonia pickettii DTP0602]|nr:hypothetical protein N234_07695 [Ralstonia pickettii DTP0602]
MPGVAGTEDGTADMKISGFETRDRRRAKVLKRCVARRPHREKFEL